MKKIKEFDISSYNTNGHYRKLGSPKMDPDDNIREADKDLLFSSDTARPGCRAPERHYIAVGGSYSLNPESGPLAEFNLTGTDPLLPRTLLRPQISGFRGSPRSEADPVFIGAVTATELVGGQMRYRCSGCLRFYDNMGALLAHIDHGRREGFSCRLFYRKLKSMREHRSVVSLNCPKLSSSMSASQASAPRPVDCNGREGTRDKKDAMIHVWLQNTEMTMSLY
ncbi:protein FAM170A [Esox lucius]|uniref:protein FAM170A n=1 Tax=Esox lucius TaxID=8010 RepID=UPI0014768AD9|nr:protein FAM170A [Esox lucius]